MREPSHMPVRHFMKIQLGIANICHDAKAVDTSNYKSSKNAFSLNEFFNVFKGKFDFTAWLLNAKAYQPYCPYKGFLNVPNNLPLQLRIQKRAFYLLPNRPKRGAHCTLACRIPRSRVANTDPKRCSTPKNALKLNFEGTLLWYYLIVQHTCLVCSAPLGTVQDGLQGVV